MIVAVTECEDCGYGLVTSPELVSVIQGMDSYFVAGVCQYCHRPLSAESSFKEVRGILENGYVELVQL